MEIPPIVWLLASAALLGAVEKYIKPVRAMIKWLVTGPRERPQLSTPMPTEYPENYTTSKEVGIGIQNIPYGGRLKWIRRRAEEMVTVTFEVIDESGESIMRGRGVWEIVGLSVTSIPPTGPYESGIRYMHLFQKREGEETAVACRRAVEGTPDMTLGRYDLKLDVYNSEERATNYVADLVVTKELQGFKIENIRPRNE